MSPRSATAALLLSALVALSAAAQAPVPVIEDDGTPLGSVLEGAPRMEGRLIEEANGRIWQRYDPPLHWPRTRNADTFPAWFTQPTTPGAWTNDAMWVTGGGTDTNRTAVTYFGGLTDTGIASELVAFQAPDLDSTEAVIGSPELGRWTDSTEVYFRSRMSIADANMNWAVGAWGNQPFDSDAHGSAFQTQTAEWDGRPNEHFDGLIAYGFARNATPEGGLDSLHILAIGWSPGDTVWAHIDLDPDVPSPPGNPGAELDIAFHAFGWDSVKYAVNGVTGTMDLRYITIPTLRRVSPRMSWRCVLQDAGTTTMNRVGITRAWIAVRPRRGS